MSQLKRRIVKLASRRTVTSLTNQRYIQEKDICSVILQVKTSELLYSFLFTRGSLTRLRSAMRDSRRWFQPHSTKNDIDSVYCYHQHQNHHSSLYHNENDQHHQFTNVQVCSNTTVGEEVCRTHYETSCETRLSSSLSSSSSSSSSSLSSPWTAQSSFDDLWRFKEHEVEQDEPVCEMVTERKCRDVQGKLLQAYREAIIRKIKDFLWNHFIKWRPPRPPLWSP